jgi:hypothetical protein
VVCQLSVRAVFYDLKDTAGATKVASSDPCSVLHSGNIIGLYSEVPFLNLIWVYSCPTQVILMRVCHWTQGSRVQTRPRAIDF